MADYLYANSTHRELPHLSGEQLRNRWRTYMKKFRETLDDSLHRTGLGLTKRDHANGIKTIEQKLEAKCPEFSRLKAIFGSMPNITPAGTIELGLPDGIAQCNADASADRSPSDAPTINTYSGIDSDARTNDIDSPGDDDDSDASTNYGEDLCKRMEYSRVVDGQHDVTCGAAENGQGSGTLDSSLLEGNTKLGSKDHTAEGDDDNVVPFDLSIGPIPSHAADLSEAADDLIPASSIFDDLQRSQVAERQRPQSQKAQRMFCVGGAQPCGLAGAVFGISSDDESGEDIQNNISAGDQANQGKSAGAKAKKSVRKPGLAARPNVPQASLNCSETKRTADVSSKPAKKTGAKKKRLSNHQKNLSLAESHVEVSLKKQEMQQGFFCEQLEFNKRKWADEKADKQDQLAIDRERLKQESASRKTSERREFILALVNQGKTAAEIKELLQIYDECS